MNAATTHTLLQQLIAQATGAAPIPEDRGPARDAGYLAYLDAFEAEEAARPRCTRCGGTGHLKGYEHVAGGICFRCDGVPFRPGAPMAYAEWLDARAAELGFAGWDLAVEV